MQKIKNLKKFLYVMPPIILLSTPISPKYKLDGFPFDNTNEVLILIILILVVFNKNFNFFNFGKKTIISLLSIFILTSSYLVSDNFYKSCFITSDTPKSNFQMSFSTEDKCQFSFQNPFDSQITRSDYFLDFNMNPTNNESIEFTNWNLHFFNQTGFNFYDKTVYGGENDLEILTHWVYKNDKLSTASYNQLQNQEYEKFDYKFNNIIHPLEPSRSWLSFEVDWTSDKNTSVDNHVKVLYVGEGTLMIDQEIIILEPSYNKINLLDIFIPKDSIVEINYLYRFNGLTNSIPNIPYASFSLIGNDDIPLNLFETKLENNLSNISLLLFIIVLIIYIFSLNYKKYLIALYLLSSMLIYYLILNISNSYTDYFEILILVISIVLVLGKKIKNLSEAYILIIFNTISSIKNANLDSNVLYSIGGSDPLKYESWSQQIIISKSLEGGESIFFYQPGYRYVLSILRLIFGDSHLSLIFFSRFIFIFLIFSIFFKLYEQNKINKIFLSFNFLLMYVLLSTYSSKQNLFYSLSEWPTWILGLIIILKLIDKNEFRSKTLIVAGLLGVIFLIRENQLIGISVLLIILIYKTPTIKNIIQSLSVFLIIFILPFLHNFYYGEKFVLNKDVVDSSYFYLDPYDLIFNFNEIKDTLIFQLNFLTANPLASGVQVMAGKILPLTISLIILQWIVLIALSKKNFINFIYISIPIGFLAPHIFYQVHTYFPRHIIQGYIFMIFCCLMLLEDININKLEANEQN